MFACKKTILICLVMFLFFLGNAYDEKLKNDLEMQRVELNYKKDQLFIYIIKRCESVKSV